MEAKVYERWDEVTVSNEKGNRVIHYYLYRGDGRSDLAVVGKERSLRHMSYSVPTQLLKDLGLSPLLKLRTRKEVVEWLRALVSGGPLSCGSSPQVDRYLDDEEPCSPDEPPLKRMRYPLESFSWVGSSWICKKRRTHYKSFRRNGVTISVNDFVYVMAEEYKRLVAYLEDMYEDTRGNDMVVVRWFHKIDEVGIVLPPNFNDREIFFSLCLQDLSVECIDGLATVLSPQHFSIFLEGPSTSTHWNPYICHRQFDNDEVKPFDVTQVQGYWNQELLKFMLGSAFSRSTSRANGASSTLNNKLKRKQGPGDSYQKAVIGSSSKFDVAKLPSNSRTSPNEENKSKTHLSVGSHIEVLSQDSGIRGCWFRGMILKKHKNKVKIHYQDIQNADETGNLEEWLPAVRIAHADKLGLRLCGRATIRPLPPSTTSNSYVFDVGTAVDAWWHGGWWEGIVVRKEDENKIFVYFPGEGRTKIFVPEDLRYSQDWLNSRWNPINVMPELVDSVLKNKFEIAKVEVKSHPRVAGADGQSGSDSHVEGCPKPVKSPLLSSSKDESEPDDSDLSRDVTVAPWNCKVPKKRRRGRDGCLKGGSGAFVKRRCDERKENCNIGKQVEEGSLGVERQAITKALKMDREICKYGTNPLFMTSMPPLSSLVMSR